jgi:hypothetical protein
MEFEIIGDAPDWTDSPRALTAKEMEQMREAVQDRVLSSGRLRGIKLYREMTRATLGAAVRYVDRLRQAEGL